MKPSKVIQYTIPNDSTLQSQPQSNPEHACVPGSACYAASQYMPAYQSFSGNYDDIYYRTIAAAYPTYDPLPLSSYLASSCSGGSCRPKP